MGASVSEGSPSYYNSLMRLQIKNVSTTSTTSQYGVWDIWETTESEEPDEDLDEESRALWKKKRARSRERWRKDRENRRRQEELYDNSLEQLSGADTTQPARARNFLLLVCLV